jgi:hypothetical protein
VLPFHCCCRQGHLPLAWSLAALLASPNPLRACRTSPHRCPWISCRAIIASCRELDLRCHRFTVLSRPWSHPGSLLARLVADFQEPAPSACQSPPNLIWNYCTSTLIYRGLAHRQPVRTPPRPSLSARAVMALPSFVSMWWVQQHHRLLHGAHRRLRLSESDPRVG